LTRGRVIFPRHWPHKLHLARGEERKKTVLVKLRFIRTPHNSIDTFPYRTSQHRSGQANISTQPLGGDGSRSRFVKTSKFIETKRCAMIAAAR
jgi:hypothetical protein